MTFIPDALEAEVRIPIRILSGRVTYFYGGPLPGLKEGTVGELVVPRHAVKDLEIVDVLEAHIVAEALAAESVILIGVAVGGVPFRLRNKVMHADKLRIASPGGLCFVGVELLEPLEIRFRGSKKAVLEAARCRIPALGCHARSVNEAYTRISETFEPERRSHTGNVFLKGFYLDGDEWRPLHDLRRRADLVEGPDLNQPSGPTNMMA